MRPHHVVTEYVLERISNLESSEVVSWLQPLAQPNLIGIDKIEDLISETSVDWRIAGIWLGLECLVRGSYPVALRAILCHHRVVYKQVVFRRVETGLHYCA